MVIGQYEEGRDVNEQPNQPTSEPALKREAGLFQVVTYGVGNIIGAGIYVLVGEASGLAGGMIWVAFLVGATVALFTGLSYAELSSMYPKAASEYVYLGRAYGNRLLSFLTQWTMLITEMVAAAAVSIGFAGYLSSAFVVPELPVAAILLIILTLIAIGGVRESLRLNTVLSLVAVAGLLIVIAAALGKVGSTSYTSSPNGIPGVLGATILVFFAYIGFDNMSNLSEETKEPEKNIPRGLLIAVAITTILYVMVGLATVSLAPLQELALSDAPLAYAVSTVLGPFAYDLLTAIALFTTFNTVLVLLIVSSRIIYGMAKEGALPRVLGKINKHTRTPLIASTITLIIALAFLPLGKVGVVAKVTSFGSLLTFALVNIALLHLRRVAPLIRRPFKAPLSMGWVSITALLGLVSGIALLSQFDWLSIVLGLTLPVSGMLLHLLVGRRSILRIDGVLHQPHEVHR
jgi:APA family basic amino acid/polyamine antiporter